MDEVEEETNKYFIIFQIFRSNLKLNELDLGVNSSRENKYGLPLFQLIKIA